MVWGNSLNTLVNVREILYLDITQKIKTKRKVPIMSMYGTETSVQVPYMDQVQ